jgi:hypothetical protein
MRLTLRTLLAYRDGVLSTADHADLHRRIQQSPDASNLLRRIEELTSSSDTLSPKLESTGLAGPNVIAEYLDDALTSTRVAELERLFLEYNEHLCELAHCHQLLAEAMHTQVVVPKALEQLALQLVNPSKRAEIRSQLLTQSRKLPKQVLVAEVIEPSQSAAVPVHTAVNPALPSQANNDGAQTNLHAAPVAPAGGASQQAGLNLEGASLTNEVPEYLLGARKFRWQIPGAILALAAILLLLVRLSIGPFDNLRALMVDGGENVENAGGNAKPNGPDKPAGEKAEDSEFKNTEQGNSNDSSKSDSSNENQANNGSQSSVNDKPTDNAVDQATTPSATDASSKSSDNAVATPDKAAPANPAVEPAPELNWVWKPADANESQSAVLFNPGSALSLIDSVNQPFNKGTLIVTPVSRTTFEVGPWKWQAIGSSVLNVDTKENQLQIKTSLCRAIVSGSLDGQTLLLSTPAGDYEIQLLDKAAWFSIEVNYRAVAKGSVVEPNAYAPTLVIIVGPAAATANPELMRIRSLADGQIAKITSAGQGIAVVKAGQMESFALQSPPMWYRRGRLGRAIDQLGMAEFHSALTASTEPVDATLRKLASDVRPEVAALAMQTSLLLGDWQPWSAELLDNDRMRIHWNNSIELARQLLAAEPAAAQRLLPDMQSKFGADAEKMIELTAGIREDSQNPDGLARLVKGLDINNPLPIRVLTAFELKYLTGEDFSYQPHAPLRASVQQWRSKLASGKISLLPVNDPIYERYAR